MTTCFISSPIATDLSGIISLLEQRGVKPLVPLEVTPGSLSVIDRVTTAITQADFVLAVIEQEGPNATVYFELGYAYALGKQILVLLPPNLKDLPFDFKGLLCIHAGVENTEALSFALDQLLAVSPSSQRRNRAHLKKSKPLGNKADHLLDILNTLGANTSEYELVRIVESALKASGISVIAHSKQPELGGDFAVWVDELEPITGNPIIIEVKNTLRSRNEANDAKSQVLGYLAKGNSRAALIFYRTGISADAANNTLALPNIFFCQIQETLEMLKHRGFGAIVRDLRNKIVHGVNI